MAQLRLFPGFTTSDGGRALLIAHDLAPTKTPAVLGMSAGGSVDVAVAEGPADAKLIKALGKLGLRVYHVTIGAMLGPRLQLRATANGAHPEVADIAVVPTEMPERGFTLGLASCFYGYNNASEYTFGESYRAATSTARYGFEPVSLSLMVGDTVYTDVAPDQSDFKNGWDEMAARYAKYWFGNTSFARALKGAATVTAWDDHEFWNDFPFTQTHLSRTWGPLRPSYEQASWEAVALFQDALNPQTLEHRQPGQRSYSFVAGGVEFFVADIRSRRQERDAFMPQDELESLKTWLKKPGGPRALVLGQPLWTEASAKFLFFTGDHNLPFFERQYRELLVALYQCPADVMILSGDVHYSRVLHLRQHDRPVYEVISSPAVHIPSEWAIGTSYVLGRELTGQAHGNVEIAAPPRYVGPAEARLLPVEYLFGHDSPNSFALVHLKPRAAGALDVYVKYIDHYEGGMPPARRVKGYQLRQPTPHNGVVQFRLGNRRRSS